MNEVNRLFENIKTFMKCNCLDVEMDVLAYEYPNIDSICELNEIMEDEISRIAENCDVGDDAE